MCPTGRLRLICPQMTQEFDYVSFKFGRLGSVSSRWHSFSFLLCLMEVLTRLGRPGLCLSFLPFLFLPDLCLGFGDVSETYHLHSKSSLARKG
ncbi:hypothetical protein Hamer_G007070 [Homarus americanus]|uniref:Uncharacterized protein n=1 Tax=Homarus americanus TaxID=6706 RepID=A0A8J5N3R8_HOMAM|nr:hypothetical protein Hamer_G007070 [Homarus americanus]